MIVVFSLLAATAFAAMNRDFVEAAGRGDWDTVKYLIAKGVNINASDTDGTTALMFASSSGNTEIVQLLLTYGTTTVNRMRNDGLTALKLASSKGHKDIVLLLLSHGADIDESSYTNGLTALMLASRNNHKDVVQLLLDKGAAVNEKDQGDSTALMIASAKGHKDIVQLLIDRGADIKSRNNNGSTALMEASREDHSDIVKLLIDRGADVGASDINGSTALVIASARGYKDIVQLLLAKETNHNQAYNYPQVRSQENIAVINNNLHPVSPGSKDEIAKKAEIATISGKLQTKSPILTSDKAVPVPTVQPDHTDSAQQSSSPKNNLDKKIELKRNRFQKLMESENSELERNRFRVLTEDESINITTANPLVNQPGFSGNINDILSNLSADQFQEVTTASGKPQTGSSPIQPVPTVSQSSVSKNNIDGNTEPDRNRFQKLIEEENSELEHNRLRKYIEDENTNKPLITPSATQPENVATLPAKTQNNSLIQGICIGFIICIFAGLVIYIFYLKSINKT